MENTKIILVTGATGFIGKHLVAALNKGGYSVHSFSKSLGRDICKQEAFNPFIDKEIDVVFHLAAEIFIPDSWNNMGIFYKTNTLGTQHVLEFCRKTNAKLVYVSAYIYGIPQYLPIDENHPVLPNNPYAHSKFLAEELCKFYARQIGVKSVILRPFNIYGAGQGDSFLIPALLKQIKEAGKIEVKDDTPKRDYLYISDFIEACILAMDYGKDFNIFNVGSGTSLSVKQVVEIVIECYGKGIEWISRGEKRINEIPETIADCRLIKDALGWKPKVPFEKGIKEILNYGQGIGYK